MIKEIIYVQGWFVVHEFNCCSMKKFILQIDCFEHGYNKQTKTDGHIYNKNKTITNNNKQKQQKIDTNSNSKTIEK